MTVDPWTAYLETRDPRLREQLIVGHLPLVRYVASRMKAQLPQHVELDELLSYGVFGLIDVIDRFDPDRGVKFETFAMPRIRGAILDELRSMDWAPRSVRSANREVERTAADLSVELGGSPTEQQIAERMGVDVSVVRSALTDHHVSRVDSIHGGGDQGSMYGEGETDRHPPDHSASDHATPAEWNRTRRLLAESLARLDPQHQAVVALHYGKQMKLREVGGELGVGQGKATRLYTEACLLIREHLAVLA